VKTAQKKLKQSAALHWENIKTIVDECVAFIVERGGKNLISKTALNKMKQIFFLQKH